MKITGKEITELLESRNFVCEEDDNNFVFNRDGKFFQFHLKSRVLPYDFETREYEAVEVEPYEQPITVTRYRPVPVKPVFLTVFDESVTPEHKKKLIDLMGGQDSVVELGLEADKDQDDDLYLTEDEIDALDAEQARRRDQVNQ
jgi:hypothetical protein